jgi:site-specific recombinase XerD
MKGPQPNALARTLVKFFQEYLPTLRGMSTHTIHSYRDSLVLYLRFASARARRGIEALDLKDLTAAHAEGFLADLERTRGNSIATRNVRLAALHTFARFAAAEAPEHLAEFQRIHELPELPAEATSRHARHIGNEVQVVGGRHDRDMAHVH